MAALPKWQEQSTKEATPSVSMKSTSTPTVSQMSQALQQSRLAAPPSERTVGSGRPTNELEKILRLARFNGSFGHSSQLKALTSIEEKATLLWAEEQWDRPIASDILVTALVLSYLTTNFGGARATW